MATKYWEPKAVAVQQVTTLTVGGTLSGETFTISVGGVAIASHTDATTAIAATVAALVAAWNASTHPYATGITAADASPNITLTADVAEVPFAVTLNTPGGSATFGQAATTAPTGPHTLDEAQNWSGEAVPANSDVIVFRDSDIDVAWGLDGLSTTGHTLQIEQSYLGKIGLDWRGVATTADGQTTDTAAPEYRATYMQLDIARLEIGDHQGIGDPGGSQRLLIDNDRASASQAVVFRTNPNGSEQGKPPVRLLAAHASAHIDIRSGVIGVAVDRPGETSTIGNVVMRTGQCIIGSGVTATNFTQHAGSSLLNLGTATLTKALIHGGQVTLDGDQVITTLEVTGGEVACNITGTIGTLTHDGGRVDFTQSGEARTVTTYTPRRGASLVQDEDVLTITNFNRPDGPSTITYS